MRSLSLRIRHIDLRGDRNGPRILLSDGSRWHLDGSGNVLYLSKWAVGETVLVERNDSEDTYRIKNLDTPKSGPAVPARPVARWPERNASG